VTAAAVAAAAAASSTVHQIASCIADQVRFFSVTRFFTGPLCFFLMVDEPFFLMSDPSFWCSF